MAKYKKIPNNYTVGGQDIEVRHVDYITNDNHGTTPNCALGQCYISQGYVSIRNSQTETSKTNTFYHELIHSILGTMGHDLNEDEGFVNCFAGFLTEAMKDAYFKVEERLNEQER